MITIDMSGMSINQGVANPRMVESILMDQTVNGDCVCIVMIRCQDMTRPLRWKRGFREAVIPMVYLGGQPIAFPLLYHNCPETAQMAAHLGTPPPGWRMRFQVWDADQCLAWSFDQCIPPEVGKRLMIAMSSQLLSGIDPVKLVRQR